MKDYRIENKQIVILNGVKGTIFSVYKKEGNCFVFQGKDFVKSNASVYGASDKKCLEVFLTGRF